MIFFCLSSPEPKDDLYATTNDFLAIRKETVSWGFCLEDIQMSKTSTPISNLVKVVCVIK
jgi:hypothetical protein